MLNFVQWFNKVDFLVFTVCNRNFANGEYTRTLRLTSELVDLQVGYANLIPRHSLGAGRFRAGTKKKVCLTADLRNRNLLCGVKLVQTVPRIRRGANCSARRNIPRKPSASIKLSGGGMRTAPPAVRSFLRGTI